MLELRLLRRQQQHVLQGLAGKVYYTFEAAEKRLMQKLLLMLLPPHNLFCLRTDTKDRPVIQPKIEFVHIQINMYLLAYGYMSATM